jgi:PTS system nitrogen regulatory IIA component
LRPELAGPEPDLRRARRDLVEVSEGEALEKLLKSFPDKGIHMAIVRDRLGAVSGLLTLEDIIEELIGEVHDEFDLKHAWSLMDVVVPQAVAVQLQAPDRKAAISQLLSRLSAAAPELKAAEALEKVWERELKFSSAVGRGVAVPHARLLELPRPMVAVGRFAKPVPFSSPDNVPVRLVFLILTPSQSPVIQLKVLGRIASLLTNENLRRRLLRAKTAETMLDTLRTADTLLAA